jgi:hypothetical protein
MSTRPPRWWVAPAAAVGGLTGALLITVVILDRFGSSRKPKAKGPPPAVGKADTENLPPQVRSFRVAKPKLEPAGSTELVADVWDPEGDPVHAWWEASCGVISPRAGKPGHAIFLAPAEPGPCTVKLALEDHELRRARTLSLTVVVR